MVSCVPVTFTQRNPHSASMTQSYTLAGSTYTRTYSLATNTVYYARVFADNSLGYFNVNNATSSLGPYALSRPQRLHLKGYNGSCSSTPTSPACQHTHSLSL